MNNRKQKVFSLLDSITEKELDDYIKDKKLNENYHRFLKYIKNNKPKNHTEIIWSSVGKKLEDSIQGYYKLGQAHIIAFILECYYDDKYKIKDIKYYLKEIIKNDKELNDFVYECIKDY